MAKTFDGINEKLKRSNENILNLQTEIAAFFQASKYPELPNADREAILEAIAYHKNLPIPLRFNVLAGEIIHHLRSCLDHIVWHFSAEKGRIEFPVLKARPSDKHSIESYQGKIKGVKNSSVIDLIEELQPYNAPNPIDSPLFIVHTMDIIDKHRELVLCVSTGGIQLPGDFREMVECYQRAHPNSTPGQIAREFQRYGKVIPQVAFKNFGGRTLQPLVPSLVQLHNEIVMIVERFAGIDK